MNAIDAMLTRRSIRDYLDKKVPKDVLDKIIECGLQAPSSKNSQPWKLYVIENQKLIQKLGEILVTSTNFDAEPCDPITGKIREGFGTSIIASGEIIKKAPVIIVVENTCPFSSGREAVRKSPHKNGIKGHDSEFLSIGAAIENISLAAHALGLATVIIADVVAEEEKIKEILEIQGDLVAALPIGYPAYRPGQRPVKEGLVKYL